jgi:hypothetical protein
MDEGPSEFRHGDDIYEGVAAEWWAKIGEQRLALIRALQRKGTPIFGSSQAVGVQKGAMVNGGTHIDVWPVVRHTISTSPQNTHAVIPDLKALLTADVDLSGVGISAMKAAMIGMNAPDLTSALGLSDDGSASEVARKAGRVLSASNEAELRRAVEALSLVLSKLPALTAGDGEPIHE